MDPDQAGEHRPDESDAPIPEQSGDVQPPQLQVSYKPQGSHGRIKLFIKWPGGSYTDKVDVLNEVSRKRFLTSFIGRHSGIDRDDIAAELDRIAEELAEKAMSDDDEGDQAGGDDDEILIQIGSDPEIVELFHSGARYDAQPFARIKVGDHYEVLPVGSKGFLFWLRHEFFDRLHRSPEAQAMTDAINTLTSMALFDGETEPVYLRIAPCGDGIALDLGDDTWAAVVITKDAWSIVSSADLPVRFVRKRGMLPLCRPEHGGVIDELREFVNIVSDEMWALYICTLVSLFRPTGPYVVVTFGGEQGSAKSTAAKKTRSLIDPAKASARRLTRDDRDLMIAANNGFVISFDNLSYISPAISDALCSLATGGGFSTRQLFTDDDEVIFEAMRPVILNGIEDLATRPDLLDRCVIFVLPPIPEDKRKEEKEIDAAFERVKPRILGALLDAVSTALRRYDTVVLVRKPRMADFARWCAAAETSFGLRPGTFLDAYLQNRGDAVAIALECSVVAGPIRAFADASKEWTGTATELLSVLEFHLDEKTKKDKDWPKSGKGMADALRRIAPALRKVGVDVVQGERSNDSKRHRLITIRQLPAPGVPDDSDDPDGRVGTSGPDGASSCQAGEQNSAGEPHAHDASRGPELGTQSSGTSGPSEDDWLADAAAHAAAMDDGEGGYELPDRGELFPGAFPPEEPS